MNCASPGTGAGHRILSETYVNQFTQSRKRQPHMGIGREFFMTHHLHINMQTIYVATVVTFGLILSLMVVSSLRAGFLLTH